MNKTVNFKGGKVKVDFEKANFKREVLRQDKNGRILEAKGEEEFIINGKSYKVEWYLIVNKRPVLKMMFEGFECGDNQKKMIEFIISKYGI